jgi:hypothetical protein
MRHDLPTKLYGGEVGLASDVTNPGASARDR